MGNLCRFICSRKRFCFTNDASKITRKKCLVKQNVPVKMQLTGFIGMGETTTGQTKDAPLKEWSEKG